MPLLQLPAGARLRETSQACPSRHHSSPVQPGPSSRRRTACHVTKVNMRRMQKYKSNGSRGRETPCQHIEVQPDGSDVWRLDSLAEMLENGAVGIIPTDSYPALVCDLERQEAVKALAAIKDVSPKKPMSILVRNFSDVDTYTMGWPRTSTPGMPDWFSVVRRVLPGSYTFILPASKLMPKVIVNTSKHRQKQRQTVGVRMPDHPVTLAILSMLQRPLLCTSAHVAEEEGIEIPDAATMMDMYPGIDFIVDCGPSAAEPSTVVDMTGEAPEVLRAGKGEPRMFDATHTL
eukprot:jgi/Ulvmu1/473/UM001_0481.1